MPKTARAKKFQPNYLTLVDIENKVPWQYRIEDEEEWEFIQKRADKDEEGNYVLPLPIIAALQGWSPVRAQKRIESHMKNLGVPELALDISTGKEFKLPELDLAKDEELEKYLSTFGQIRAYLEAQVSYHNSKCSILESVFEESMNKALFELSSKYTKKPTKEIMRGEAVQSNPHLKKLRQELIEEDALYRRVIGLRDAYKAAYDAVSRIVALRIKRGGTSDG